jgi:hypothetical protein
VVNVLGPLFHHSRSADGETRSTAVAWPVGWYSRSPDHRFAMLFPVAAYRHGPYRRSVVSLPASVCWNDGGVTTVNIAGPLFHCERRPGASWSVFAPFPVVYVRRTARTQDASAAGGGHVFPLVSWEYRGERRSADGVVTVQGTTAWRAVLGMLATYARTGETSEFRLLKYLVRRDRDGDAVYRDFFPFVSWDSGPDRARFTLLWRVINCERSGEDWSGHVLFVPWGDR